MLLVLVVHISGMAMLEGAGVIGVTVFFTLSGFLITALLLSEHATRGRASLVAFYKRRARRILPALYVTIAAVTLAQAVGVLVIGRAMTVSALLSVSNLYQLAHPGDSALSHTWSLGIEEQFYLIWPALLLAGLRWRGRRGAWTVGLGALAVSLASMLWSSPGAMLWGSLPRAASLLAGCLLAIWLTGRREGRGRPVLAGGVLALGVPLALGWGTVPVAVYVLAVPTGTVVVLLAVSQGAGAAWLSGSVLRWFGRRSYGLYLLHYPIVEALGRTAAPYWVRVGLAVTLSLAAAELSWRIVEAPILHGRRATEVRPAAAVAQIAA